MSAQYSHPVDFSLDLIVHYPATGADQSYAVLHENKCNHLHRQSYSDPVVFAGDENYFADDFFKVSPCAKLKKKKK